MPTFDYYNNMEFKIRGDRKASKPLMEKRRRARINHCLAQLKSLVVDKNENENSRQTKLEKADILELTVRHLYEIKRQQRTATVVNDPKIKKKFELGFIECAKEVDGFFSTCTQLDNQLKQKLKAHLSHRLKDMGNLSPIPDDVVHDSALVLSSQKNGQSSVSENGQRVEDINLTPKRLPNGDLAVVIPPHLLSRSSCVSCPLSAFRLICSPLPSSNCNRETVRPSSSTSSLSPNSSISDVSEEESNHHHQDIVQQEYSNQSVWRPW